MLENEPTGGERPETLPTGDTTENTTPTRRARPSRRKAVPPEQSAASNEPGEAIGSDAASLPGGGATAPGPVGGATAPGPVGGAPAPDPGGEPARKVTRRRKAAAPVAGDTPDDIRP